MQQYSQIVIDNLPLMLNQESKTKASVKIASYMNSMLRNSKTEQANGLNPCGAGRA